MTAEEHNKTLATLYFIYGAMHGLTLLGLLLLVSIFKFASVAGDLKIRAVRIRPAIVSLVTPEDVNIVLQRIELPAQEGFDLIVATNIFVYYDLFEQSLDAVFNGLPILSTPLVADLGGCLAVALVVVLRHRTYTPSEALVP